MNEFLLEVCIKVPRKKRRVLGELCSKGMQYTVYLLEEISERKYINFEPVQTSLECCF